MGTKKVGRTWAVVVFSVVLGIGLGKLFALTDRTYERLALFSQVMRKIVDHYVKKISEEELIYNAIKGMVSLLDPHSSFMTPDEYKEMTIQTKGKFGGLGIEITKKDWYILVISPIEDTPAWRAGIKPGDKIIKIEEESTKNMSLREAVKRLRGEPGTKVTITILRDNQEPFDIILTRAIIKVKSVKAHLLDGIVYVKIREFNSGTEKNLVRVLRKNGIFSGKISGVILDLRNNPGGLLDEGIDVADVFLKSGIIVKTSGRDTLHTYRAKKNADDAPDNVKLVVLVNKGSASASEIVAGALKDLKRAKIVGEKTFGKASVQTIFPMSDGSAIKLTTAYYLTPSGRNINKEGIEPDFEIKDERKLKPEELIGLSEEERLRQDKVVQFALKLIKGS